MTLALDARLVDEDAGVGGERGELLEHTTELETGTLVLAVYPGDPFVVVTDAAPITGARSSDDRVYVEHFGDGAVSYLTVFNDADAPRTATITLEGPPPASCRDLVRGAPVAWLASGARLALDPGDVAVLALAR